MYNVHALHMTPARAAAYLGCATILAAWLASAAGIGERSVAPFGGPYPVQSSGTETLAEDVQAQAVRLRAHLASAPAPQRPTRNPFEFAARPSAARPAPVVSAPASPPVATVFPEPVLSLVGVAADGPADALVRTAIITAEGGEMFMLKVGEFIGARYRVESIGTDAVELSDRANGTSRRLVLR
jgi:hypothetical protein